jgi:hypothetical protein
MIEIHIYPKNEVTPTGAKCVDCGKPIENKPAIVIIHNPRKFVWYCVNCVRLKDYCKGNFPCSK